ncbi:uncharacterized protein Bfra_000864 [Botrytis fragariae]|uniref:Uncharacterized protein n=1 Tax=Botrytis fragariae TaxID=1964551 RepID=A0A8H6B452_9HELO|nr:uncharacterized protein Bfra_000864 [Botrytis fragariae]KAF5878697.1 hypothetical protein Bfra_000864 [Botrytis fragariae]
MGFRPRKYRPKSSKVMIDESERYSVYASECMLLPGYMEQSITLDMGTHGERRRFLRYSIEFEVEPEPGQRDSKHGYIYGGYSQSHRLGKTKEGEVRSFLKTLKALHKKTRERIELNDHRFKKLEYVSAVLKAALEKGSLLVHQRKLELLEHGRDTRQARFIRPGARKTKQEKTRREKEYERREVRRDETLGRINNSRVAEKLGVQLRNNEKRSRKRHDRMRYPSQSDAESTGSWETASSVDSYSEPSHGRRRRSSSRHYDGYTSGYHEDDSSDDESDTRSHASTVFSKSRRPSSYGSRSSISSGSSRSNSDYMSRHRSGRHNNYQTNDQLRKPPSHPPNFKHGYGTIPTEDLPYPDEPYPGRAQPYHPYDDRADYHYDYSADNPYDDRADNPSTDLFDRYKAAADKRAGQEARSHNLITFTCALAVCIESVYSASGPRIGTHNLPSRVPHNTY